MSNAFQCHFILLVEDSGGDVELVKESLKGSGSAAQLHVARDGEAALQFLRRKGPYRDAPRPDLMLLDLNMPLATGRQLLTVLKGDPDLRSIPVVTCRNTQFLDCTARYSYGLQSRRELLRYKTWRASEFQGSCRARGSVLAAIRTPTRHGMGDSALVSFKQAKSIKQQRIGTNSLSDESRNIREIAFCLAFVASLAVISSMATLVEPRPALKKLRAP